MTSDIGFRRAAVTGGAGFIGSTVVDHLVAKGCDVLVVDDLSRGSLANLGGALAAGAELVELDVRDGESLEREFIAFRPEVVFHLAAQIDVRLSMERPALDAHTNVVGSITTFQAAHRAGARRVVNTSTGGAIYGETDVIPTPETVPPRPLSAYGLSKRTSEEYASWFRRTAGPDVVTLRYGNVYGPRQDPRGDAGVIAIFIDTLLAGGRPTVFGDGRQTRDFVLVDDVARANVAAAVAGSLAHDVYNVGSGTEVSVLELLATLTELLGADPVAAAPEFVPLRPGEVQRSCLDVRRARAGLGLAAPTPLRTGLAATVAWIRTLAEA
ncbi:NAD-dependent epimerase/dehydratase family protein [Pseudonocardia sp. DSM 110487]|uniref:NAD-dependent epimerase/dehydratase family protein n=1 Tax=Pseudonocardia sp. DSM 110487 TaxID=2865833 RepID=UPI001C6A5EAF|nr:NAD-dependent epimerase/dehydratase family protein [Pseudonocardia sp. DSM 110487]QYN34506.1 NAD-dependent epimerase/dehydratase family protein [Pseudonocardia sp. DSM 110487]